MHGIIGMRMSSVRERIAFGPRRWRGPLALVHRAMHSVRIVRAGVNAPRSSLTIDHGAVSQAAVARWQAAIRRIDG